MGKKGIHGERWLKECLEFGDLGREDREGHLDRKGRQGQSGISARTSDFLEGGGEDGHSWKNKRLFGRRNEALGE